METRQYTIYRLHFTTPLHIGSQRDDYGLSLQSIASDTMYAAITATLANMGEGIPKDGDLGCVISGLFPYYSDGTKIEYYFPKPFCTRLSAESATERKKLKKQLWLPLAQFEHVLQGKPLSESFEMPDFIHSQVSERVQVSRDGTEDATPFYMDRVFFSDQSGLFFLVEGETQWIDKALPLLALEGIGTDRNVGNGAFEYQQDVLSIAISNEGDHALTLSTFIPTDKEQLTQAIDEYTSYELIRRGGWITTSPYNTFRKNAIYAFAAGSVFRGLRMGDGRIVDLAPQGLVEHPVWRCGKAFFLPIKLS